MDNELPRVDDEKTPGGPPPWRYTPIPLPPLPERRNKAGTGGLGDRSEPQPIRDPYPAAGRRDSEDYTPELSLSNGVVIDGHAYRRPKKPVEQPIIREPRNPWWSPHTWGPPIAEAFGRLTAIFTRRV